MSAPTRKAVKYEKKVLKAQLMHLRNLCADWADGIAIMDEDRMKSKDFKHDRHTNDYPARSVPPSPTQLWLMRCTVRALYDERAPHMGKAGLLSDPDLSKETVKEMKAFFSGSALFPHLLQLPTALSNLADTSYLWMREFYLELCQRVQFPISMSLPWMLTEHVLQMRNRPLMPFLFAPMDVYNDAGMASLFVHKQQYLFTEIEAEVNLCFDQILYSLSEQIFTHFKSRASLMLLHTKRSVQDVEASGDKIAAQAMGKNASRSTSHVDRRQCRRRA
jgi:cytoplasmic FMR1 interacting protein